MNIIALIRRFVPPYKNRMVWNILFNLSSTILSLFSFAAIIPVLYILFGLTSNEVQWVDMQQVSIYVTIFVVTHKNVQKMFCPKKLHFFERIHYYCDYL